MNKKNHYDTTRTPCCCIVLIRLGRVHGGNTPPNPNSNRQLKLAAWLVVATAAVVLLLLEVVKAAAAVAVAALIVQFLRDPGQPTHCFCQYCRVVRMHWGVDCTKCPANIARGKSLADCMPWLLDESRDYLSLSGNTPPFLLFDNIVCSPNK